VDAPGPPRPARRRRHRPKARAGPARHHHGASSSPERAISIFDYYRGGSERARRGAYMYVCHASSAARRRPASGHGRVLLARGLAGKAAGTCTRQAGTARHGTHGCLDQLLAARGQVTKPSRGGAGDQSIRARPPLRSPSIGAWQQNTREIFARAGKVHCTVCP
jgi:hypothetical protein